MRKPKIGEKIHIRGTGYSFENEVLTITVVKNNGSVRGYVETYQYDKEDIWNINKRYIQYITIEKNLIGGKLL